MTPDGAVAWTVEGGLAVQAIEERVPGDVSAAAFWLVAGAIHPDAELDAARRRRQPDPPRRHRHPARDGRRHRGAAARRPPRRRRRRADRRPARALLRRSGRSSSARPTSPPRSTRSRSCAWRRPWPTGTTVIRGAGELRHKESDRIAGIGGGPARARRADRGRRRRPPHRRRRPRCAAPTTDSLDDHRLAMTFAIAGLVATGETSIGRPGSAAVSYPGFFDDLERVRA